MSTTRRATGLGLTLMLLTAVDAPAAAATATDEAAQAFGAQHVAPMLAQSSAAQCVNGYRVTHRVQSGDRVRGGVILKCRG
jgi:hypothetical protein